MSRPMNISAAGFRIPRGISLFRPQALDEKGWGVGEGRGGVGSWGGKVRGSGVREGRG